MTSRRAAPIVALAALAAVALADEAEEERAHVDTVGLFLKAEQQRRAREPARLRGRRQQPQSL